MYELCQTCPPRLHVFDENLNVLSSPFHSQELLDKIHPMEAKRRCDELEGSLKIVESTVNTILQDVHTLREGNYVKGESLHKRSLTLYQRWVTLRKRMQVSDGVNFSCDCVSV